MSDSEAGDNYERHYCLRWKYHHSNLQSMFAELLEQESFCDVTLTCEGKTIRAHKLMLSASSPYFYTLFSQYEESEPVVILKDIKYDDIKTLIEFMYKGEIHVENSQLNSLLQTAKELQIKCLAAVSVLYEDGALRRLEPDQSMSCINPNKVLTVNKTGDGFKRKLETCSKIPSKIPCLQNESEKSDKAHDKTNDSQRKIKDEVHSDEDGDKEVSSTNKEKNEDTDILDPAVTMIEDDQLLSIDENSYAQPSKKTSNKNGSLARMKDIVTMTQYVQQGGKRPNFWDIPTTRSIMEDIKNKKMEMKRAAVLLGVSYGTLYGRYRDCYGYLKHPYRLREFWLEPDSLNIINKITRKEISLFKGAELLNVSATSLANYLATLNHDTGANVDSNKEETVDSKEETCESKEETCESKEETCESKEETSESKDETSESKDETSESKEEEEPEEDNKPEIKTDDEHANSEAEETVEETQTTT